MNGRLRHRGKDGHPSPRSTSLTSGIIKSSAPGVIREPCVVTAIVVTFGSVIGAPCTLLDWTRGLEYELKTGTERHTGGHQVDGRDLETKECESWSI